MFNDLGAIGNYSAPGAFRGQVYNTYSGGSLMLRAPNKTYQLMAINYPPATVSLPLVSSNKIIMSGNTA
jgi:conjugative transfer pilus assembly protein TraH